MEKLKFFMEDRAIAELLGRQSFTNKESAILELIKNSYDAGAKVCNIVIFKDEINILDDGKGMDKNIIKNNWMSVGNSDKEYLDYTTGRIQTGSKGIGRFALARVGDRISMESKKSEMQPCLWITDWEISTVEPIDDKNNCGTSICIKGLRDVWKEKDVENLANYISRVYKNNVMKINLYFEDKIKPIKYIYSDLILGEDFVSKLNIKYDSKNLKLEINVVSDEFVDEVKNIVLSNTFKVFQDEINVLNELNFEDVKSDSKKSSNSNNILKLDEIKNQYEHVLSELGDFTAEFYFRLARTTKENMKQH